MKKITDLEIKQFKKLKEHQSILYAVGLAFQFKEISELDINKISNLNLKNEFLNGLNGANFGKRTNNLTHTQSAQHNKKRPKA